MDIKDYYQILGISQTASADEIKKAYRNLALKLHPDRNKAMDAHERFIEITEAYEILFDPSSRNTYDYLLRKSNTVKTDTAFHSPSSENEYEQYLQRRAAAVKTAMAKAQTKYEEFRKTFVSGYNDLKERLKSTLRLYYSITLSLMEMPTLRTSPCWRLRLVTIP